jgi:hypothetical protein
MDLQSQVDRHRKEIHTDSYPMSIGELVNLYRDGELEIHPEYQRFFRWTLLQKSRWIESVLLGIPLPSIFVAQREDGVWDLVDGLQRVATLLQFMGELRDESGRKVEPLRLLGTKYLPALEGKAWQDPDASRAFTAEQQRFIKRAKLTVNIVLRESPEGTKYELFQRLNTGGTFLSDQELRSALLIAINRDFYRWLVELAKYEPYQGCLALSDRQIEEQYDLELAVRFVVLRTIDPQRLIGLRELSEFLTDEISLRASARAFPYDEETRAFRATFEVLYRALESDVFRKYDPARDRFTGGTLVSAFEVVALGVGFHHVSYEPARAGEVTARIKERVWSEADFLTSSGQRASQRLPRTIRRGREVFE